jgi:hypothetical protein
VARDWKWEGRSYFSSLIKGWKLIMLRSNTMLTHGFKARRCRSSFLDLLFIHNPFSILVSNS